MVILWDFGGIKLIYVAVTPKSLIQKIEMVMPKNMCIKSFPFKEVLPKNDPFKIFDFVHNSLVPHQKL